DRYGHPACRGSIVCERQPHASAATRILGGGHGRRTRRPGGASGRSENRGSEAAMRVAPQSTIARLHRQRPAEAGLTLIELLISLMLLVLITGFLAGGLAIGRRAFSAEQDAAVEASNAAALDSL